MSAPEASYCSVSLVLSCLPWASMQVYDLFLMPGDCLVSPGQVSRCKVCKTHEGGEGWILAVP